MTSNKTLKLGVNIGYVATLRQARGTVYPAPADAVRIAEASGADSITVHLREDRRHISDADIEGLMASLRLPLNFEMAATPEMQAIALRHRPHAVHGSHRQDVGRRRRVPRAERIVTVIAHGRDGDQTRVRHFRHGRADPRVHVPVDRRQDRAHAVGLAVVQGPGAGRQEVAGPGVPGLVEVVELDHREATTGIDSRKIGVLETSDKSLALATVLLAAVSISLGYMSYEVFVWMLGVPFYDLDASIVSWSSRYQYYSFSLSVAAFGAFLFNAIRRV